MDARADNFAPRFDCFKSQGNQVSGRGKDDGGSKLVCRSLIGATCPSYAQRAGKGLRFQVAGADENEDLPSLIDLNLTEDVRSGPKTVETNGRRPVSETVSAIANQTDA